MKTKNFSQHERNICRRLYEHGIDIEIIAQHIGVPSKTLSRWKEREAWQAAAEKAGFSTFVQLATDLLSETVALNAATQFFLPPDTSDVPKKDLDSGRHLHRLMNILKSAESMTELVTIKTKLAVLKDEEDFLKQYAEQRECPEDHLWIIGRFLAAYLATIEIEPTS
jgi:hypothetical protein